MEPHAAMISRPMPERSAKTPPEKAVEKAAWAAVGPDLNRYENDVLHLPLSHQEEANLAKKLPRSSKLSEKRSVTLGPHR